MKNAEPVAYKTRRLLLREANLEDDAFIYELLNSPTWIQHIGNRNIKNLEDARQYINNALINSYRKNGFGMYIMAKNDMAIPIGLCGFLKREELEHVDIGFAIMPAFAGKGFTYEAAERIISESDFPVVYGITYEGNIGSRRLLEKLGLRHIRNFQFGNYNEVSMLFSNEVQ